MRGARQLCAARPHSTTRTRQRALDNAHSTTRTRTRPRLRAPVADAKLPAAHARYLRTLLAAADAPSSGAAFPSLSSSHA